MVTQCQAAPTDALPIAPEPGSGGQRCVNVSRELAVPATRLVFPPVDAASDTDRAVTYSLVACQICLVCMNQEDNIGVLRKAGSSVGEWRKTMPPVELDHRHCQEIIMEIGERLRAVLRHETTVVSPRIEQLLQALRDREKVQ
jgi:hypothetical protein